MNALVVYDSKFGNTRRIAETISDALEKKGTEVNVIPAEEATPLAAGMDLLVVGGPTHAHGASAGMKAWLDAVGPGALSGVSVTAFDTRFQMARWLSGSAALAIAKRLRRAGGTLIAEPESFFVTRDAEPALLPGEIERAAAWAQTVCSAVPADARQPVAS